MEHSSKSSMGLISGGFTSSKSLFVWLLRGLVKLGAIRKGSTVLAEKECCFCDRVCDRSPSLDRRMDIWTNSAIFAYCQAQDVTSRSSPIQLEPQKYVEESWTDGVNHNIFALLISILNFPQFDNVCHLLQRGFQNWYSRNGVQRIVVVEFFVFYLSSMARLSRDARPPGRSSRQ